MPGVCGTSLVLPGWLVLGVMVGMGDIQTPKTRHCIVTSDLSGATHTHVYEVQAIHIKLFRNISDQDQNTVQPTMADNAAAHKHWLTCA